MTNAADNTIEELIERSSLGTAEARRRRQRVSLSTGQALARAAAEKSARRAKKSAPASGIGLAPDI